MSVDPTYMHNTPPTTANQPALRVWLVEDDASIRWVLERALRASGMVPRAFDAAEPALAALRNDAPDVLLTDIRMPGSSGIDLLREVRAAHPTLPVIVMTAHSDLPSAVSAYEGGAFEYLPKPFDIDQAVELVRRAGQTARRGDEAPQQTPEIPELLGKAPAMQQVFRAIGRLSRSSVAVLITGESGTGKELVARALHEHSPRQAKPFVALNTSAIPAELLESELFGHEKGSFTGADTQRRGRFEQANGGTLFLDEIGDMSTPLQTRLLRVLAEGEFYRVGGQTPVKVDVRVIAATHQNLEERVERGIFREDLYHRLNVIRIELPPLRSRTEDVPDLLVALPAAGRRGARHRDQDAGADDARAPAGLSLAGQRARAGESLPAPHGAGAGQRDPAAGPALRNAHRHPGGADRLGGGAHAVGQGAALRRHGRVARPGAAGIRARADPRGAESHPRASPGSRARARLGPQHADPQAQGTRHVGRRVPAVWGHSSLLAIGDAPAEAPMTEPHAAARPPVAGEPGMSRS